MVSRAMIIFLLSGLCVDRTRNVFCVASYQGTSFSRPKQINLLRCHLERRPNDRRERGRSRKIPTMYESPCNVREFSRENALMPHSCCTHSRDPSTTRSHALALRSG